MHNEKENLNKTLEWACDKGYQDVVELLLDSGADIHFQGDSCLHLSVRDGDLGMVNLLFQRGALPTTKEPIVFLACMKEDATMLRLLLEKGADAQVYNNSSLTIACRWKNKTIAKTLLEHGVPHTMLTEHLSVEETEEMTAFLEECISELDEEREEG